MRTPDVRTTSTRASVTLLGVLALVFALLPAVGFAQEAEPDPDRFTCEATLLRIEDNAVIGTVALGEANTENDSCQSEDGSLVGEIEAGPVTADLLYARTDHDANDDDETDQGFAESGVANVLIDLDGNEIEVELLTAEAQAGPCPSTDLSGDATVVGLRINDDEIAIPGEHAHIPLQGEEGGPIGNLHLEHTEESEDGTTFTSRALWFEDGTGVIGDIIIAEAIADVHGDPCGPTEPPTDRFAGFFTGGGFVAEPGSNRDHNGEGEVDPGTVAHHAFVLDCFEEEGVDPHPRKDNLVVQWFDEDNNEHASVKVTELEDTRCFFDEEEGDASPPASEFNTIEGSGLARCRTKVLGEPMEFDAEVEFRFTDEGEPGRNNDEARIEVTSPHPMAPVFCNFTSDSEESGIDGGNHQAHQLPSQAGGNGNNGGSNASSNRF